MKEKIIRYKKILIIIPCIVVAFILLINISSYISLKSNIVGMWFAEGDSQNIALTFSENECGKLEYDSSISPIEIKTGNYDMSDVSELSTGIYTLSPFNARMDFDIVISMDPTPYAFNLKYNMFNKTLKNGIYTYIKR